jgi:plasmid replication initiation protein
MALQDKTPIKTGKDGRWLSFLIDKKRSKKIKASGKPPFSN